MSLPSNRNVAQSIRSELESTRSTFHELLESLSEDDLHRQSLNPGWTNGEILAHMLFGFIVVNVPLPLTRAWGKLPKSSSKPFAAILNAMTKPFNWFNALGARGQAKVFTYKRLGKLYNHIHTSLMKKAASIRDEEWEQGMYYPTKWDANFGDFMTLEQLFHYPVIHFNFHLKQISR